MEKTEISYAVMVFIGAYICGAINRAFFDEIPNKYIPLQNVFIGIFSGIFYALSTDQNIWLSITMCLFTALGAGGASDLKKLRKGDK